MSLAPIHPQATDGSTPTPTLSALGLSRTGWAACVGLAKARWRLGAQTEGLTPEPSPPVTFM